MILGRDAFFPSGLSFEARMDRGSSDRNLPVLLSKKSGPQKLMLRCADRQGCTATAHQVVTE